MIPAASSPPSPPPLPRLDGFLPAPFQREESCVHHVTDVDVGEVAAKIIKGHPNVGEGGEGGGGGGGEIGR